MIFLGLQGPANTASTNALKIMMKSSLFIFRFKIWVRDFLEVI